MIKKFNFILDVDGVLTSGKFFYSVEGKVLKEFGPHDAFSLKKISPFINISFISADFRGFEITKKRIDDMGYEVSLVSEDERYEYISEKYELSSLIYMGDGDSDAKIIKNAYLGIAPNNARPQAKQFADYITNCNGGNGAVAEACDWINNKLF